MDLLRLMRQGDLPALGVNQPAASLDNLISAGPRLIVGVLNCTCEVFAQLSVVAFAGLQRELLRLRLNDDEPISESDQNINLAVGSVSV